MRNAFDYKYLDPVGACLEGARHPGGDADRVHRPDLHDVLIELDAPGAGEDQIDLLGPLVLTAVGLSSSSQPTGMGAVSIA